jgi:hypothetical protein
MPLRNSSGLVTANQFPKLPGGAYFSGGTFVAEEVVATQPQLWLPSRMPSPAAAARDATLQSFKYFERLKCSVYRKTGAFIGAPEGV